MYMCLHFDIMAHGIQSLLTVSIYLSLIYQGFLLYIVGTKVSNAKTMNRSLGPLEQNSSK